jgi:hypothetical protein
MSCSYDLEFRISNNLRYDYESLRFIIFLSPEYGDDRPDFPVLFRIVSASCVIILELWLFESKVHTDPQIDPQLQDVFIWLTQITCTSVPYPMPLRSLFIVNSIQYTCLTAVGHLRVDCVCQCPLSS